MSRFLFTVPPLTGHLNPALAVAHALEASGHEVAWAVHAREIASKLPPRAQLYTLDVAEAAAPSNTDLASSTSQVRGLESVRVFFEDYALPLAEAMLAPLEAAVRSFKPDVLVVDHQMLGGALVARKLGLRWASLITTTASILKLSPVFDAWVAEQYLGLQQRYLPAQAIVERPDFSPELAIVFSSEALVGDGHARIEAPYRFVGPARDAGRRAVDFPWHWLEDDKQKLLISLGTVSRDRDTRFFEVMMAALAEMPQVQAVMVAPATLASLAPANVLVRDYVPQSEVLTKVDGVICHAGHNTVCESLSQGLPMIVAPIRDDQPVIARQVIDAGAGLFMRQGKVTPPTARRLIEQLLSDTSLREGARRLQQALAQSPGAAGAAALIADLARQPSAHQPALSEVA